ncbi:MAG: hypothetical protein SOZ40_02740, partial [Ezakiella sp.]|nr:hypothetical protein [Ezakiella sp.]
ITRAEVVAIANKAFNRPIDVKYIDKNIDKLKTFQDVNSSDWYYYDVICAANDYFTERGMSEWINSLDSNGDYNNKLDKDLRYNINEIKFQRYPR